MPFIERVKSSPLLWITFGVTLIYAILAPFTYFRHDDWIHLGNSVVLLPKDWSLLWRATQFYTPEFEQVWFFRPFVKLLVYLNYQAFGYFHPMWVASHWTFTLGAIFFGAEAIKELTGDKKRAWFFGIAFLASFHLHFGSIAWVGEGIMNCPQIFFLSLCLYFFVRSVMRKKTLPFVFAIICYITALGFKESSAFFPLLLAAILYQKGIVQENRSKLTVFFSVFAVYLYYRLGILPFNPGYRPRLSAGGMLIPLVSFTSLLSLTALAAILLLRPQWKALFAYLPFLALTIAPHIGHTFFSPGWLLLPGFFMIWIIAVSWSLGEIRWRKVLLIFLLTSATPVLLRTYQLDWIHWYKIQKDVHNFLRDTPDHGEEYLIVENCPPADNPTSDLNKVVGAGVNLEHIWILHHDRHLPAVLKSCGQMPPPNPKRVHAKWTWQGITRQE